MSRRSSLLIKLHRHHLIASACLRYETVPIALGLAAAAFAGFWGVGRMARRLLFPRLADDGVTCAVDVGIGAWLTGTAFFFIGLSAGYRPAIGWTVFAISIGAVAWNLWRSHQGWRMLVADLAPGRGVYERLLLGIGVAVVALAGLGALTPPAAQDALVHHLALPKTLIALGRYEELPYNYFSYFPGGMEMLYLYALLIGGASTATLLHLGFGVMTIALIATAGRWLGLTPRARLIAALAFATVPTVWMEMTWAYVDLALTFFVTLAVLAMLRFRAEQRLEWMCVAGVALGGALSIKFTALALFMLLPMLALLMVLEQNDATPRRVVLVVIALIAPALATGGFWLVRNILYTGNPVFPLFVHLIPSRNPGWDAFRGQVVSDVLQRYGGTDKTLFDYVLTPFKLSFLARYGVAERYDGIVGPFFLAAVPMIATIRRWPVEVRYLLGFSSGYFLVWLFTSQQVRYLLPALPVLALAIAAAIDRVRDQILAAVVLAVFVANAAVIVLYFVEFRYGELAAGRLTRENYLRDKFDYYPFYEYINANTPASSRIFLVVASNQSYYLEREYFSDSVFEDYTLRRIVQNAPTAAAIAKELNAMGITHLLFRPRILFGNATTPFTAAETLRFTEFLTGDCISLMADDHFTLYALRR